MFKYFFELGYVMRRFLILKRMPKTAKGTVNLSSFKVEYVFGFSMSATWIIKRNTFDYFTKIFYTNTLNTNIVFILDLPFYESSLGLCWICISQ